MYSFTDEFEYKLGKDAYLVFKALRIFRIFRIFFVFPDISDTVSSLLNIIPALARTFVSLLVVFLFYTIWGLHLFKGNEEYRCRLTPEPIFQNEKWIWEKSEIEFLCGYWVCPKGTYCRSPADYNIEFDYEELNTEFINYGYITYSNFFKAWFTVFHFFSISIWSSINYTVKNY